MKLLGACGALLLLARPTQALRSSRAEPAPVTRVVTLLTELKARIEKDGELEQQTYDKFACWCETITANKAKSITDVRAEITSLGNKILQLKGTVATTISEIKDLTEDIRKNEANQRTATEVRQRENAAFNAEKVELEQAIAALDSAIAVLSKGVSATSLLHTPSGGAAEALARLHAAASRLPAHARPAQKHLAVLEAAGGRKSAAGARYAPQSATVQGILHDMYSSFSGNLESLTHQEGIAYRNYEALMATWAKELAALHDSVTKKERLKAETEMMLADGTQGYADSEAQLQADVDFFDATKASCLSKTDEWSARKALRAEELDGITQALAILSSDAARDLFAKAIKPGFASFLQEAQVARGGAAPLERARQELQAHARRGQSLRLAALAASIASGGRLHDVGHFDQVIKAIDTLLAELDVEEAADTKKVDDCKNQTQNIDLKVQDLEWQIKKNDASIQKLKDVVAANEAEKTEALADLGGVEKQMNESKAMRTDENGRFLQGKSDDEQAIALLKQARTALSKYFSNNSIDLGAGLLQEGRGSEPNVTEHAPDATFSSAGRRKGESKGIISLLSMIIEDLEAEIAQAQGAEASAQLDYEKSLAASEALAKQLREKIVNLNDAIAARNTEITAEEDLKLENQKDLDNEEQTRTSIKPACDWYIAHQQERREKRALEVEGLTRAKEYLAGASLPSLVQGPASGPADGSFASISFSSVSFLQRRW